MTFFFTVPVTWALINRGKGHAVVNQIHHGHERHAPDPTTGTATVSTASPEQAS